MVGDCRTHDHVWTCECGLTWVPESIAGTWDAKYDPATGKVTEPDADKVMDAARLAEHPMEHVGTLHMKARPAEPQDPTMVEQPYQRLFAARPAEPELDEDEVWEALAQDIDGPSDDIIAAGVTGEAFVQRHRPRITAAIRARPSEDAS